MAHRRKTTIASRAGRRYGRGRGRIRPGHRSRSGEIGGPITFDDKGQNNNIASAMLQNRDRTPTVVMLGPGFPDATVGTVGVRYRLTNFCPKDFPTRPRPPRVAALGEEVEYYTKSGCGPPLTTCAVHQSRQLFDVLQTCQLNGRDSRF